MFTFVDELTHRLRKSPTFLNRQLVNAIVTDDVELARDYLRKGANINQLSEKAFSPLMYAIFYSNLEMLEMLLQQGANVNQYSGGGVTPLLYACQKGRLAMIENLLARGANIDAKHIGTGNTPLIIATQHQHTDIVKALIAHGARPELTNHKGDTAYTIAVKMGHRGIQKALKK